MSNVNSLIPFPVNYEDFGSNILDFIDTTEHISQRMRIIPIRLTIQPYQNRSQWTL